MKGKKVYRKVMEGPAGAGGVAVRWAMPYDLRHLCCHW